MSADSSDALEYLSSFALAIAFEQIALAALLTLG